MDNQNIKIIEENERKYRIEWLHSLLIKINITTTVQEVFNSMKNKEQIKNLYVYYTLNNAIVYDSLGIFLTIVFREPLKVIYYIKKNMWH